MNKMFACFNIHINYIPWLGKEKDKESGLGDHGVRKYNNISGRFLSIDPLWEKYLSWTPQEYAGNNPVNAYDVDGKKVEWDVSMSNKDKLLIENLYQMTDGLKDDWNAMLNHENTVLISYRGSKTLKGKDKGNEKVSLVSAIKGDRSNMYDGDGTDVFIAFNMPVIRSEAQKGGKAKKNMAAHIGHESDHAIRGMSGTLNDGLQAEYDAMGHENYIRSQLKIPLLNYYDNGISRYLIPKGPMIPVPLIK